jgi:hypothetical protein
MHLARGMQSLDEFRGFPNENPIITLGAHGLVVRGTTGRRGVADLVEMASVDSKPRGAAAELGLR